MLPVTRCGHFPRPPAVPHPSSSSPNRAQELQPGCADLTLILTLLLPLLWLLRCPSLPPPRPDASLGKNGHSHETPRQTLVREALEFQQLYHKEKGTPPAARAARQAEILADIEASGTYTHTYDELQHGARVAWR